MTVCCNTFKFPLRPAHYFSNKADKKYLPREMLDFELHFPIEKKWRFIQSICDVFPVMWFN